MCEHKFTHNGIMEYGDVDGGTPVAMYLKTTLVCLNCGKLVIEKSYTFTRTEIFDLKSDVLLFNEYSRRNELINSKNGVLVRDLFYKKLNKKYNLNLTIDDC